MKKYILIGIGNPFLKDDRVGLEVVERAKKLGCPWDVEFVFNVGFELIDKILGYDEVILVDASLYNKSPGNIIELDKTSLLSGNTASVNTHTMSLSNVIDMGYTLFPEEMPRNIKVFLIEAKEVTSFSYDLSPEVKRAVDEVVNRIKSIWDNAR